MINSKVTENKDDNKNNKNKIPFFKKILMSIKDFDKYNIFAQENLLQSFGYIIKLMAIFTVIITIVSVYKLSLTVNTVVSSFNNKIEDISYENDRLTINNNDKILFIDSEGILGKIEIDTSDLSDNQIEEYKNKLNENSNGILILKDEILIKNENLGQINELSYKEMLEKYSISSFTKQDVIDYYNKNVTALYMYISLIIFMYMFVIYVVNVLMYSVVLSLACFIISKIIGLRITFTAAFNMSMYAQTLSIILNMIYIVINTITGFNIKYFQVMYSGIACIYIITAILMIKSDLIKRHVEVRKIEDEEQKVKDEIARKEQERKDQEEKDNVKQKDKKQEDKDEKSDKKEKNNKGSNPVENKPEGSNV